MDSPEGIAIDHLGRTLFWTDSVKDRIEVASLDGSQRRVIVDTDLVNPRAIIADPNNGCVSFPGQPFNAAFQLLVFPFLFDRVSCLTLGKKTPPLFLYLCEMSSSCPVSLSCALLATVICTGQTGTATPPRLRRPTWMDPTEGCWSKTSSACLTA